VAKGIRRAVEQIQANWKDKPISAGLEKGMGTTTAPMPAEAERLDLLASKGANSDPLLARVVDEFSAQMTEAAKARGAAGIDKAQAKKAALSLIDNPDQKRVLWVDDKPSNNLRETAALAKLQIEVVPVTDTEAALERIAKDPEAFDLVLSDWQRPERTEGAPSAGIHLLRALRARQLTMPVVFYHGSFSERERRARHELALAEGAYGEAVMPDELLVLVAGALGLH
jgi:CheY-like chemotaxis protein